MSDLQIGLIALGLLLILLLWGFNRWQDWRVRRKMQDEFPAAAQDPLLGAGETWAKDADAKAAVERREPGMSGTVSASVAAAAVGNGDDTDDKEEPDPVCEAVIEISFSESVRGADLLPYVQNLRSVGRKPVRVFAETDQSRHRARVHPDESYSSVQLAVLLANRSGALTAIEWSQAWVRAQDLAERFDAHIEGPDQQEVLEQAARLDDTCAALDTQVGLTLLLADGQSAAEVLAVAREQGFAVDGQRLAWLADSGVARFTLVRGDGAAFEAGVNGLDRLNLLLDVPCSPADPRAFGRMVDVARTLATRLRADLVDDQGKPLAAGSESIIDERLQVLFSQLEQAGLPAGSIRAQRVFA